MNRSDTAPIHPRPAKMQMQTGTTGPGIGRIRRYLVTRGWAHALLLFGSAMFLFPFFWMVITSLKTDEELAESRWLPAIPRFRACSPYPRPEGPPGSMAQLLIRGLQLRTLDAHIHNLCAGQEVARTWTVESGNARLVATDNGATRVEYRFDSPQDQPLVLRYEFDFPAEPDQLHKLALAIQSDDSWHRLEATLDLAGRRWVSQSPTYLAQHRAQSILFQPPTFDDTTYQPKVWVPLREREPKGVGETKGVGSLFHRQEKTSDPFSRHAVLRISLRPTSTAAAVWAKVMRNYQRAFAYVPFWRYVANSLVLVALITLGTLFSSCFVAYAFARLNWPGRGLALLILLATMMLPPQVTMIPSFMIWRTVGAYNTLAPLWAPAWFGSAFFIFLMIQQMKTLPRELEESARIDGLNALQTWYYIILPQVKPTAAAIAIMAFMWSWNDFLGPLIYLRDQSKFPLSLGLFSLRLDSFGDQTLIMAGNVLITLPVMAIFFACQRYFIQGMTVSGLKG
ncbi:MAG TPA: carbohydrate ABC transporter permease [Tepidisphaeraceae bacterium]|nr:carbohydrate ABC transporter permease [Tepidisphaeraceae bacterium]